MFIANINDEKKGTMEFEQFKYQFLGLFKKKLQFLTINSATNNILPFVITGQKSSCFSAIIIYRNIFLSCVNDLTHFKGH